MKSFIFTIYIILAIQNNGDLVSGLDENGVREMQCPVVKTDPSLNTDWVESVPKWYFPIWSKLAKYRMASVELGKSVAEISEKDLVNDCETFATISNKGYVATGFHNPGVKIVLQTEDDGAYSYWNENYDRLKARDYGVLTDNKEFLLEVQCWNDNQTSWLVSSPTPTISPKNREIVMTYLKALGFDMSKLVEESYDHCDDPIPSSYASVESIESSEDVSVY